MDCLRIWCSMAKKKKTDNHKITSKKKDKVVEQEKPSVTKFNLIFINFQLFLTFFTFGLFVWYIFDSSMIYTFQLFLGITLLVMAYNNQIIYHRKKMTVCYSVVGIFLLVLDFIMYILTKVGV